MIRPLAAAVAEGSIGRIVGVDLDGNPYDESTALARRRAWTWGWGYADRVLELNLENATPACDQEGLACLAIGFGPHYDANGKYTHRSFVPGFHRWPDEADRLLDLAMEKSPTGDVYVTPLLRGSHARTKDNALPGAVL